MALTSAQVVDVRRHMGYSATGNTTAQPYREPAYTNVTFAALSIEYRLSNLTADEEAVITTFYLPNLQQREQDIQTAAANLDTEKAAVWTRNTTEISDRQALYRYLRMELCKFLGFPPGSGLSATNRVTRC